MFEGANAPYAPLLEKKSSACTPSRPVTIGILLLVTAGALVCALMLLGGETEAPVTDSRHIEPRLRIFNGCASDSLWIANFAFQSAYFPQDIEIKAGQVGPVIIQM